MNGYLVWFAGGCVLWEGKLGLSIQVRSIWMLPHNGERPGPFQLDGNQYQHPCTCGLQLSYSSCLFCMSKCVGCLWSEAAWGSRSSRNTRLVRPADSGLSEPMVGSRIHREKYLKPCTVLLAIKPVSNWPKWKGTSQYPDFIYYMVWIRCSWFPNHLWVQVLSASTHKEMKDQLKRSLSHCSVFLLPSLQITQIYQ